MMAFAGYLLAARQYGFDVREGNGGGAAFISLYHSAHHLALQRSVFVIQRVSLSFTNLLNDDLLRRLGTYSSNHFLVIQYFTIADTLNDSAFAMDLEMDFSLFSVVFARCGYQGSFNGLKDNLFLNFFIAMDCVYNA